jgi:uncharacterized membrane-anchored protein YjiN (DUF445 family)
VLPKRLYGPVSLAIAAGGFVAVEYCRRRGWIVGDSAELLGTAFEAATVGAVADWFAVAALFRRVPIPVLGRHTDIIARNRARITDNIVDIVGREWLAPEVVGAKLGELLRGEAVLAWLEQPRRREQAAKVVRGALALGVAELDRPEAAQALAGLLAGQLGGLELARPLGAWLAQALARGEHDPAWRGALRALAEGTASPEARALAHTLARDAALAVAPGLLERAARGEQGAALAGALRRLLLSLDLARPLGAWLAVSIARGEHQRLGAALVEALRTELRGSPGTRRLIEDLVDDAIARWKGRGWRQRLLGGGAELVGALRPQAIAADVASALDAALEDATRDAGHPLRRQIDLALAGFATRLAAGEPALAEPLARLVRDLVERADLAALASRTAGWLRDELARDHALIDWDALGGAVLSALAGIAREAAERPDHPLRARGDAALRTLAERLADGEPRALALAAEIQRGVLERIDLAAALRGSLARLKADLGAQLATAQSPLMRLAAGLMDRALAELRSRPDRRAALERWLRSAIAAAVHDHHALIGDLVRAGLDPAVLSDRELVDQIESKVGDDLQYIRLNGAIVGGLVGVALAAIKLYAL